MPSWDEVLEGGIAAIISAIAAAVTWAFVILVGAGLIGAALFKLRLLSDEGEAWIGISLGVPLGFLCAMVVFVCCFRALRNYAQK